MPIIALQQITVDVSSLPSCAIDLGFSERGASIGISFYPINISTDLRFGVGVSRVNKWINDLVSANQFRCVLILEAPLSMSMTKQGNPCHRDIELQRNYAAGHGPLSPKGWYYQAGANLSLGSTMFLRGLVVPRGLEIFLAEGFYCRINRNEEI
jgi:hypothetical protein